MLQVHDVFLFHLGAFQVLQLVQDAGLKVDCKLYTTLVSTCAKSGKVDAMFEVWYLSPWFFFSLDFHQYLGSLTGISYLTCCHF